ncbi:hypothetical protein TcG_00601 [Trypanosoma cruzi]|nr:hypothetical protein TcG_00601 [Trypanosoma cruzi]
MHMQVVFFFLFLKEDGRSHCLVLYAYVAAVSFCSFCCLPRNQAGQNSFRRTLSKKQGWEPMAPRTNAGREILRLHHAIRVLSISPLAHGVITVVIAAMCFVETVQILAAVFRCVEFMCPCGCVPIASTHYAGILMEL